MTEPQTPPNYNHTDPDAFPDEDWRRIRRKAYWWGGGLVLLSFLLVYIGYDTGDVSRGYRLAFFSCLFAVWFLYVYLKAGFIHQKAEKTSAMIIEANTKTISLVGQKMTFLTVETINLKQNKILKTSMKTVKPHVVKGDVIVGSYCSQSDKFLPITTQFNA